MSSTHEPFHLLEPSNLLEPFDPRDCHDDLANWSARLRGDEGPPKGQTRAGRTSGSVRIARDRGSPVRAILSGLPLRVSERAPRCRSSGTSHPATVLGSLKARDDWPTRTRMASNRRRRVPMSQSRIQRAQNRVNRMHRVPTQAHLRSRPLRNLMLR